MLLAIDTATRIISLALHDGEVLLAECTLTVGRNHSACLAPMVQQIMAQSDASAADLKALAVSVGPGSYTGLRIGVALAKGMAAVRNLPLVPVSTLDTIAAGQTFCDPQARLVALVPAGRSRVISAEYRAKNGRWATQGTAALQSWEDLLASYDELPICLTGEITRQGLQKVRAAVAGGQDIRLIPPAERLRRAGYLAEAAWRRLRAARAGQDFSAERVMPIYLKSPG